MKANINYCQLNIGRWMPSLLVVALFQGAVEAAVHIRPDDNTLWYEDGSTLEVGLGSSKEHWNTQNLNVASAPAGGLLLKPQSDPRRTTTSRLLPVSADYPFMVMEIAAVSPHARAGGSFSSPTKFLPGYLRMSMGIDVPTGLWVHQFLNPSLEPRPFEVLRWDVSGFDVTVASVRVVREPDYWIELETSENNKSYIEPGDKMTFTVRMAEPAEDVTLTFFCNYRMHQISINGQQRIQLKPDGENYNCWQTSFKLERLIGYETNPGPTLTPGRLIVRATVLGGGIRHPVYSCNTIEIRPTVSAP